MPRAATPASVYRGLNFLLRQRLAHCPETADAYVACGHPDRPHAGQLLLYWRCGMVAEIENEHVAAATAQRGQRFGFTLDQPILELTGVCKPCPG